MPTGCRSRPTASSRKSRACSRARRACTTRRPRAAAFSTASPACGASTPGTAARRSRKPWRSSSKSWTTRRAFQMGHPDAFTLANELARLAPPGIEHVFFTNSGSESVDTALKIALAFHRAKGDAARTRLIGRERGYHGVGFGGISVGGMTANRKAWPASMIPGVDHLVHTHDPETQCVHARSTRAWRRAGRRSRAAGRSCTMRRPSPP